MYTYDYLVTYDEFCRYVKGSDGYYKYFTLYKLLLEAKNI